VREFADALRSYESWMAERLRIRNATPRQRARFGAALAAKHQRIARSDFAFLRGTFFWWLERWEAMEPRVRNAPRLLAVGDLHLENFGVWRDQEGRLVWGVNDLDEAHELPFTNDLVRLATSLFLAIDAGALELDRERAVDELVASYRKTLKGEGAPLILEAEHQWLRRLALLTVEDGQRFWDELRAVEDDAEIDIDAAELLRQQLHRGAEVERIVYRDAGIGSLGKPRYVAIAQWQGGLMAREAKAALPSAAHWRDGSYAEPNQAARAVQRRARRALDPALHLDKAWTVRRLSPESRKLELGEVSTHGRAARLVRAMGVELANLHLGTAQNPSGLRRYLRVMPKDWLGEAADQMAKALSRDRAAFAAEARGLTSRA
jgi:uncharacterized protein (DUF2252 family)